ncbi:MAG TPA: hypothetical protein VMI13_08750 [Solirubrobacteraceae bacterium]|nr:hypothetical protein [Solirubrobacteraceae bacterium]
MHGRGSRLLTWAVAMLAVPAAATWASTALGDSGPKPPKATTGQALEVDKTSAKLTGTVELQGAAVTECKFEYGTSESASEVSKPCSSLPAPGSEAVEFTLANLTPNTTYYFKVVATSEEGTGEGSPVSFKTIANAPVASIASAREVKLASAVLVGAVNPEGAPVSCEFEYGPIAGAPDKSVPCSPGAGEEVTAQVTGLTPGTTYYFRVAASGEGGEDVSTQEQLTTPADELAVTTGEATTVTKHGATLKGTVTPGASAAVTSCEFEYGTVKGELTGRVPCSGVLPGAGTEPVDVSAEAGGLAPNTTYYFKLVADNEAAVPVEGVEAQFKTSRNPPAITTGEATGVTQSTATLTGTVNPEGEEVKSCAVEYGTARSLGSSASCSSLPGSGSSPVEVTVPLAGLSPGTTYYYRVVAASAGGEEVGEELRSFTTLAATPSPGPSPAPSGGSSPPPKGPEAARPPALSGLSESNQVFRVGRGSTKPAGRISRVSPVGTVFSFALDQAAVVTVTFIREESGHLIGKSCVVGRRGAGKPACIRSHVAMRLARRSRTGVNRLPFTGRVRGRALPPGAYRATFTAESLAGSSAPVSISFRVVAH